jgi:hypothetical protein
MANISTIPEEEMIEDYYASKLEYDACAKLITPAERALANGVAQGLAAMYESRRRRVAHLQRVMDTNKRIMEKIDREFEERGKIPPWRKAE